MHRRIFHLFVFANLAALLLTIALWIASYTRYDRIDRPVGEHAVSLLQWRGRIGAGFVWKASPSRFEWTTHSNGWRYPKGCLFPVDATVLGFGCNHQALSLPIDSSKSPPTGLSYWTAIFPHWFVALLTTIAPGYWLYRRRHPC